jgi:osmoprotectant transport system permease protein
MTPRQQLLNVELPLALPVIIAGVRTSAVLTIGAATLSTPVGATSLGNYIFSGLQTRNLTAVLVGCVACAVVALAIDGLIRLVSIGWTRRHRGILGAALGGLVLTYGYVGVTLGNDVLRSRVRPVVVGAKTFTEQYILSEILAGQIVHHTGLAVDVAPSLGSTVAFDGLRTGEIDAYVDYSGTIWATLMGRKDVPADRSAVLKGVTRFLREQHDIAVVGALGFENAYVLAMRRAQARQLNIRRISDLARHAPALRMGADYEFLGRAEWRVLQSVYGLAFATRRSMDPGLMYQAVAQENVDVISAFSTDGRIVALDLLVLEDDRGAIPPYDAVILASQRLQSRHPEAIKALGQLVGTIDDEKMRRMNLAVDQTGQTPAAVGNRFLGDLEAARYSARTTLR